MSFGLNWTVRAPPGPRITHLPVVALNTAGWDLPDPSKVPTTGTPPLAPWTYEVSPREDRRINQVFVLGRYAAKSLTPSPSKSPWNGTSRLDEPNGIPADGWTP